MRLISSRMAAVVLLVALAASGCNRHADSAMPGDGTFRAEKARAQSARDIAEERCRTQTHAAAKDDCLTRAEAEYGRLVAAAELRRDAREVDLPEIAKSRSGGP